MATQFLFPVADVSPSGWTPTPLWEQLNDHDTADVIESTGSAFGNVRFNGVDPEISTDHTFRVRARYTGSPTTLILNLYVGSGSTLWIGDSPTWDLTDEWATYEWTLSTSQADNITDYSFLQVRHIASLAGVQVAWSEVQLGPDVVPSVRLLSAVGSGAVNTTTDIISASTGDLADGELVVAIVNGDTGLVVEDDVQPVEAGWTQIASGMLTSAAPEKVYQQVVSGTPPATYSFEVGGDFGTLILLAVLSPSTFDTVGVNSSGGTTSTSMAAPSVAFNDAVEAVAIRLWSARPLGSTGRTINEPEEGSDLTAIVDDFNDNDFTLKSIMAQALTTTPTGTSTAVLSHAHDWRAYTVVISLEEVGEPPQLAAPIADAHIGTGWVTDTGATTSLFAAIDEATASDSDFIRSPQDPTSSVYVCQLGALIDPGVSDGHIVRYRYEDDGNAAIDLTVQLRQGYVSEASLGTLIEEWVHNDISGTAVQANQTLGETEADAITDYTDLYLRFIADMP